MTKFKPRPVKTPLTAKESADRTIARFPIIMSKLSDYEREEE